MTGDTPVVNADSPQASLAPLSSPAMPVAPDGPQSYSAENDVPTLTVRNGDTVTLDTGDLPAGTPFGFRITAQTSEGSWKLPAVQAIDLQTSTGGPQRITVTIRDLAPGTYSAGVLTGTFTHSPDIAVTVLPSS